MGGVFGLGILLTLKDQASSSLGKINGALNKTQNEANSTQRALDNIELDARAKTSFDGGLFTDALSNTRQQLSELRMMSDDIPQPRQDLSGIMNGWDECSRHYERYSNMVHTL